MTIPASTIVQVNPGVLNPGGNALVLNGLFLTENPLQPTNTVLSFSSVAAVAAFYGASSTEAAIAAIYFAGFNNATLYPNTILFATYNSAARSAFLQGGSLAGMTLAQLNALSSGELSITSSGVVETSSSINLSSASSFTNAATIITAAFITPGFTVTWSATLSAFVVTETATGSASTLSYATDATGTLAESLLLTAATATTLSQGANADTPSSAMANVIALTQNWAFFTTLFEPDSPAKTLFEVWAAAQTNRYAYIGWDSSAEASASPSGNTSVGALALVAEYNGVAWIGGDPSIATAATLMNTAAFILGWAASINFAQQNGRVTSAFRTSGLLVPTCANQQLAANLLANGYSFYGSYATANQGFIFFYNGQMPGEFEWLDTFADQVYLNSQFQSALLTLVTQVGAVAYDPAGYSLIRSALQGPINAGLNFGSIRTGVVLSSAEIAEVNAQAGVDAATQIQNQGYFLQILDPGATARAARQTPIINFWYADGGAVQKFQVASIDVL